MEKLMQLVIDPHGDVRCVYSEEIELAALGQLVIRRGSHVEPDHDGRWWADLSPVSGPSLGPFARRTNALAAERDWLEHHWLVQPGQTVLAKKGSERCPALSRL
jgi:hypothetical protein